MTSTDSVPPDAGLLPLTESSRPLRWCVLNEDQWRTLQEVRLTALKESPRSFLSKYGIEVTFGEKQWRDEFSRGEWIIAGEEGKPPDALIGVTRSNDVPSTDRYLEYLWVSPKVRHSKVATNLIHVALKRLEASRVDTVWLWILDGNEPARELYNKLGFTTTGERHRPKADRSLWEERMKHPLKSKT
jgi:ribosomal protein S18 acetylase RimI-like enzyme